MEQAFAPSRTTVSISVSGASARVALTPRNGAFQVRVWNNSSFPCFMDWGGATVTATTSDLPIAPGAVETFTIAPATSAKVYVAAIGTSGTLYITQGMGL